MGFQAVGGKKFSDSSFNFRSRSFREVAEKNLAQRWMIDRCSPGRIDGVYCSSEQIIFNMRISSAVKGDRESSNVETCLVVIKARCLDGSLIPSLKSEAIARLKRRPVSPRFVGLCHR